MPCYDLKHLTLKIPKIVMHQKFSGYLHVMLHGQ